MPERTGPHFFAKSMLLSAGMRGGEAARFWGVIALVLFAVAGLSVWYLPLDPRPGIWSAFPERPFLNAWTRADGGWYFSIAERGYFYTPGKQCSVPFFPMYPLMMRALGRVVGSSLLAGMIVTALAGVTTATLFYRFCRERMEARAARVALGLLLLWPFAYYLYFTVYADALFLAAALGAFALLEGDQPLAAGLVGAVATATRPVGVALVVGLAVRALERRRAAGAALRPRDFAVLLSATGVGAYLAYLWWRFGDPLVFTSALSAWNKGSGWATLVKRNAWLYLMHPRGYHPITMVANAVATALAWAWVPRAVRRFGWGYGIYAILALGLPTATTDDFLGMGRYVLGAFPCFAAAGEWLAARPRATATVLFAEASGLATATSFFARWFYLS